MSDLRLKAEHPEKASEILFDALTMEKSRLQYSLELSRKRLAEFEKKYNVSSLDFLENWSAEDLEGQDMEYVKWAGEYRLASSLLQRIDILNGITHANT